MHDDDEPNFAGVTHALHTGLVLGILWKHHLDVQPEVDALGDYTDVLQVTHDDRTFRLRVLP